MNPNQILNSVLRVCQFSKAPQLNLKQNLPVYLAHKKFTLKSLEVLTRQRQIPKKAGCCNFCSTFTTKSSNKESARSQDLEGLNQQLLKKMLWLRAERDSAQTQGIRV